MTGNSPDPAAGFKFPAAVWVERVPSTNSMLRELVGLQRNIANGHIIATQHQTAGRGRFEREWVGQPGRDLAFSFLLWCEKDCGALGSLPMAVALGVGDALADWGVRASVKWPNDVVVKGRKVCGILAERCEVADRPRAALVVGVGLNLNMTAGHAASIDQPATSVLLETGRELDPFQSLAVILSHCERFIRSWLASGFNTFREEWTRRCLYTGTLVTVTQGERRMQGTVEGFGREGELLLREADGTRRTVWSGEMASLRPHG